MIKQVISWVVSRFRRKTATAPYIDEDGWLQGLGIIHITQDADLPFGRGATRNQQPIEGIIVHHPAVPKSWSIEDLIELINNPRPDGHHYGYTFAFDVDGLIYQTAPLTKRTNHFRTSRHVRREKGAHLNNKNAIGFCFHLADHNEGMAPNKDQVASGKRVYQALASILKRPLPVYGHGQVQTNRHELEGRVFAELALSY